MSKDQHHIAVDQAYKIRDNQFWYNDCSFADVVRNKTAIVMNIDGLGIRTLKHSEQGKDGRKTPSYKFTSREDRFWWEEHRGKSVRLELMKIDEEVEPVTENILIVREYEFYQGYIRFKVAVTNESFYLIGDVILDFLYDYELLHIDRYEPQYTERRGKFYLGSIDGGKSKSISIYFDPLMCSKGTDIDCHITFKDYRGNRQIVQMKPKEISVVCPIIKTDFDINIGRLKEFIDSLPNRDSRVYEVLSGFDVTKLANITREVLEKLDIRHVRTLHTKDENNYEIWYYGRTKVTKDDIVIKVSILLEQQILELFIATCSSEVLTGLLAEVGRELKQAVESKASGKGNVINITIKDSVVQRSNLLDMCDTDGTCDMNVVIENSVVQRTSMIMDDEKKKEKEILRQEKEEAIECYDKAIELKPDDANLWAEKGTALEKVGRYKEAIECYDKAIELNPYDDSGYSSWTRKWLLLIKLGRDKEADVCYDKSLCLQLYKEDVINYGKWLERSPDDSYAWKQKGNALYKLGRHKEAIECYDKAIELKPDDANLWENKRDALYKLGRHKEAIECYNKAIELKLNDG